MKPLLLTSDPRSDSHMKPHMKHRSQLVSRVCPGLTCPNSELRMVRKLMSEAEEAALDLRERLEDLLDSGTREHEDGDGLLP